MIPTNRVNAGLKSISLDLRFNILQVTSIINPKQIVAAIYTKIKNIKPNPSGDLFSQ